MKLILYNNRAVQPIGSYNNSAGTQYENIATTLEIDTDKLSLKYNNEDLSVSDCTMVIHFWQTSGDTIGNDIVTGKTYSIENNVTKYKKVYAQIQLIYEDFDWRSDKFLLKFGDTFEIDSELEEAQLDAFNQLASSYQNSIDEVSNLNITASKEDGVTTITITSKDGSSTTVIVEDGKQGEQGVQGVQGNAFTISKTYPSIEDMEADVENVEDGTFVMIASNVEDEDNAKLYYHVDGAWLFITDFSGATGIQGEQGVQGEQGIQGEKGDAYTITETDYEEIASIVTDSAKSDFNETVASAIEEYNNNADAKITEYNENASELIEGLDKKEPKHNMYRMYITEGIKAKEDITTPASYVLGSNLSVIYCGQLLEKNSEYTEIDENTIQLLFDVSYSEMYNKYIDFLIKEAE